MSGSGFFIQDVEIHERAGEGGRVFAVTSDHLAGGTRGGDVYVYTNASVGERLDVSLGANELEILVDDGPLELWRAVFVVLAQVPKPQLPEAAYAGRYCGFSDSLREGERFEDGDQRFAGLESVDRLCATLRLPKIAL